MDPATITQTMMGYCVLLVLSCVSMVTGQGDEVLTYQVVEQTAADTPLGNISIGSNLISQVSDPSTLRLSIVPQSSIHDDLFYVVDNQYGELRTKKIIDREDICPQQEECFVPLDILVKPSYDIIKIEVKVIDINDNEPVFSNNPIVLSINEISDVATVVALETATDLDSPQNGIKGYQLSDSDTFALAPSQQGNVDPSLILTKRLDREQNDLYTLELTAFDGTHSGSTEIQITVMDSNDNPPIFKQPEYDVFVLENRNTVDPVIQVEAGDLDTGTSGQVIYGFDTRTQRDYGEIFRIDRDTGEIFVKSSLDYEVSHQYTLFVEATNPDSTTQASSTRVTIMVQDVNDNDPQIKVNTFTEDGIAAVSEWSDVGTFVARLSVRDPDEGSNGEFTCQMNSDHFQLVQLSYVTEFKIVTKAMLNRESASVYQLIFVCTDGGTPGRASTKIIKVHVLDENDNPPKFTQALYGETIKENAEIGSFILQVSAWDEDEGKNSYISYNITDPAIAELFHIDPTSGSITIADVLDYEANPELEFTVTAVDGGSPQKSATATVLVKVEDLDDEAPNFTSEEFSLSVHENELSGTTVSGEITAVDRDSERFNKFQYSIDRDSPAGQLFDINPQSGRVTTKRVFDREEQAVYKFVVRATGTTGPEPKTSTADVTVYIVDINDHSPVITYPNSYNNTVYVTSDANLDRVVARILAHDLDGGPNAQLSYHIIGGNVGEHFAADEHTGAIYVNKSLSGLDDRLFGLVVEVKDHGDLKRTAEVMIKVIVREADEGMSNLKIVIIIAAVAAVAIVILCIAIVIVFCRLKAHNEKKYNHMPRYLDQKNLTALSVRASTSSSEQPDLMYMEKQRDSQLGYYNTGAVIADEESSDGHISPGSDTKDFDAVDQVKMPPHMVVTESQAHKVHKPTPYMPDVHSHRSPPPVVRASVPDKDSDSGCSADMSHTTDIMETDPHLRMVHHHHHHHQPPPIPPKGLSRARQIPRPPPINTQVLPPGVHGKRTPSSSSDNTAGKDRHLQDSQYQRPYASFNDGYKPRPMVSMDTRDYGKKYGHQGGYHGNPMNYSMQQYPLNSIHDDSSEISQEASQV